MVLKPGLGGCRPLDELDAFRCAKMLLDRYGAEAAVQASFRVDDLDAAGDEAGRQAWLLILSAIDELSRTERRGNEQVQ